MSKWSVEDLAPLLDTALGDDPVSRRRTLQVENVVRDGGGLAMDVVVTDASAHVDRQRWRLSFSSMWDDIAPLPLDGARITVRANLEEWWDTRHSGEPWSNLTAQRIGDPRR